MTFYQTVAKLLYVTMRQTKERELWVIGRKVYPVLPIPLAHDFDIVGQYNKLGSTTFQTAHVYVCNVHARVCACNSVSISKER